MKFNLTLKTLTVLAFTTTSTVSVARSIDENTSMLLLTSLSNMGASTLGARTTNAVISVTNLQCQTFTVDGDEGAVNEMVTCSFDDQISKSRVSLTESLTEDDAFDVWASLSRATGKEDSILNSVLCEWNDTRNSSGNYTCDIVAADDETP